MLRRLVVANLFASGAHFLHNAVFLDSYPGPPWITTAWVVVVAWILVATSLVLGYRWHLRGKPWPASVGIAIYGASCLLVFGHYVYGSAGDFDLLTNLLIVAEGIGGLVLLAYFFGMASRRPIQ